MALVDEYVVLPIALKRDGFDKTISKDGHTRRDSSSDGADETSRVSGSLKARHWRTAHIVLAGPSNNACHCSSRSLTKTSMNPARMVKIVPMTFGRTNSLDPGGLASRRNALGRAEPSLACISECSLQPFLRARQAGTSANDSTGRRAHYETHCISIGPPGALPASIEATSRAPSKLARCCRNCSIPCRSFRSCGRVLIGRNPPFLPGTVH